MSRADEVAAEVARHRDDIVRLASELIRIPSVNPPGDVSEAMGFLRDFLRGWGFEPEWIEPVKGRVSLLVRVGSGDRLILNGHVDVVPPGDRGRWSFDPFSGEVVGGYLLGRGASDMKGPLAAMIYAFLVCASRGAADGVTLMIVPDEETGGEHGTKHLVGRVGVRARYCLIAEPSTLQMANIGEKGILWLRIAVEGKPAHASLSPYIGENAIERAARIISALYRLSEVDFEPPRELREVADRSGEVLASMLGREGLRRIFRRLSCNVGTISGGVKVNVVAPACTFEFDIRIPPGARVDDVTAMVRRVVEGEGGASIEVLAGEEPSYTSPHSPVVAELLRAAEEELGRRPELTLIAGATDGRHTRAAGIDTVIYGPGEWETIHSYDEKVSISDLVAAAKVYARLIARLSAAG